LLIAAADACVSRVYGGFWSRRRLGGGGGGGGAAVGAGNVGVRRRSFMALLHGTPLCLNTSTRARNRPISRARSNSHRVKHTAPASQRQLLSLRLHAHHKEKNPRAKMAAPPNPFDMSALAGALDVSSLRGGSRRERVIGGDAGGEGGGDTPPPVCVLLSLLSPSLSRARPLPHSRLGMMRDAPLRAPRVRAGGRQLRARAGVHA
jgi:hypothetical protein